VLGVLKYRKSDREREGERERERDVLTDSKTNVGLC
jgi:hypothetical protein